MLKRTLSSSANEIGVLCIVLLLTVVALTPLLRTDPPCTHDGGLHYYRIVAMRQALEDGLLVSRWVPDLAFGYGYPFFNYREAFPYYSGLALYLLGFPLAQALNVVYILSLVASAIGAYLFGRDLFGRRAGLVAAVAYVYAPYPFIDALTRGNMPESVALALLPFILWSFRRLLLTGQARYVLVSAGTLALLWLSHNISSLLFTPFLVTYLLVVWLARGRKDHPWPTVAALALGLGLTAFFWAPAILEKNLVQLHLSRTTRNNDFHYNFVDLAEIFAPPQAADTALLNPPLNIPVGLPLAVLAGVGILLGLWRAWDERPPQRGGTNDEGRTTKDVLRQERWVSVVFFALAAAGMVFMSTRASLFVWERLPLIDFVQFPWRFIGRAILPLSLLAGAASGEGRAANHASRFTLHASRFTFHVSRSILRFARDKLFYAAFPLLILSALPWTYPPTGYCPHEARPDMLDLFTYEHWTGQVGIDPEGSYFPVTVRTRPTGSPLEAQYAANLADPDNRKPIARFDETSLPAGAVIHRAEYAPNRARLEIETPVAFRARYLAFAFPGWRVLVDDRRTDITPSDPEGLITFELPAGRRTVEVMWGSTLTRSIATMVSLTALAAVVFIGYTAARNHLARRIRADTPSDATDAPAATNGLAWRHILTLALLALALLAFKLMVVDRRNTLFRRPGLTADGTLPRADISLDAPFADGVRLLGYDRSADRLPADGTLHLAVYWSAAARPARDYRSTVALVGSDGQLWSPKSAYPRRGYADLPPSSAWGNGRYVVEGFDVEALPGAPPGVYALQLTAFDRESLTPLNVLDAAGQVAGPNLTIGRITLTRPSHTPDPADIEMQTRLDADLGPVNLLGANLDRTEAAPGDPMLITVFWQAASRQPSAAGGLAVHLALVDETRSEAAAWDLPPVREDWPTTEWQAGDLWRGQHLLRLPGALESGDYTWKLQIVESGNQRIGEAVALGKLRVNAPERTWEAPPLQIITAAELGDRADLLGANVTPSTSLHAPATLTVTLAWQARAEMETSYSVFLHLLRPDGSLLTQSDGEPVSWTRPTTGWAPGEILLDVRTLDLPADAPPGDYTLVAGLYDPNSNTRLTLPDGTDAVFITAVTVDE